MPGSLEGVRVLVTRPRAQSSRLAALLRERGATAIEIPLIDIEFRQNAAFDRAIEHVDMFTDIVVTSANAAAALRAAFERTGSGHPDPSRCRLSAVGPSTSQALEVWWRAADVIPPRYVAESLLETLLAEGVQGRRFLIGHAAAARDVLIEGLRAARADVQAHVVYEAVIPDDAQAELGSLDSRSIDLVTATSSSTVRHLAEASIAAPWLREVPLASIGPITSASAAELGFRVIIEANASTVDGLVAAIETAFAKSANPPGAS